MLRTWATCTGGEIPIDYPAQDFKACNPPPCVSPHYAYWPHSVLVTTINIHKYCVIWHVASYQLGGIHVRKYWVLWTHGCWSKIALNRFNARAWCTEIYLLDFGTRTYWYYFFFGTCTYVELFIETTKKFQKGVRGANKLRIETLSLSTDIWTFQRWTRWANYNSFTAVVNTISRRWKFQRAVVEIGYSTCRYRDIVLSHRFFRAVLFRRFNVPWWEHSQGASGQIDYYGGP